MANRFQKTIYYLSAMTPVLFVFAIVWIVQEETFLVPLIIVTLGMVLIVIFSFSFTYGKKNVAPINVRIQMLKKRRKKLLRRSGNSMQVF